MKLLESILRLFRPDQPTQLGKILPNVQSPEQQPRLDSQAPLENQPTGEELEAFQKQWALEQSLWKERVAALREEKERVRELTRGVKLAGPHVNSLGFKVFKRLCEEPDGNLAFSPACVAMLLAVLRAGARGSTAVELDSVLEAPSGDHLAEAFTTLAKFLTGDHVDCELDMATSMWSNDGFGLKDLFVYEARDRYLAEMRSVDFAGDPANAVSAMNEWVARKTNGLIPAMVSEDNIRPDTTFVLANAVYFKSLWEHPFSSTVERNFFPDGRKRVGANPIKVSMMTQTARFRYGEDSYAQFLELPYRAVGLSMIVVLPKDQKSRRHIEASLSSESLRRYRPQHEDKVNLALPKFRIDDGHGLAAILADVGVPSLFSSELADFSAMSDVTPTYLSEVIHRASIRVGETGTEAAAFARGMVSMGAARKPRPPVEFHADTPFLFFIYHAFMDMVLFVGRVTHPGKSGTLP
jgi:serpin B